MDRSVEGNDAGLALMAEGEDLSSCSARNDDDGLGLVKEEGVAGVVDEAFDEALLAALKQDLMKAVDVRATNLLRQPPSSSSFLEGIDEVDNSDSVLLTPPPKDKLGTAMFDDLMTDPTVFPLESPNSVLSARSTFQQPFPLPRSTSVTTKLCASTPTVMHETATAWPPPYCPEPSVFLVPQSTRSYAQGSVGDVMMTRLFCPMAQQHQYQSPEDEYLSQQAQVALSAAAAQGFPEPFFEAAEASCREDFPEHQCSVPHVKGRKPTRRRSSKTASSSSATTEKKNVKRKAQLPKKEQKPRTSKYRGVSRHRLTKRWEASCWVHKKQLYLGGFDDEERAARAYDVVALVCKGFSAEINFELEDYLTHIQILRHCTQEEVVAHIRRQSSAFARGRSRYRGVSGTEGRWEARIGKYDGKKNATFGFFETEEDAARQYDRALLIQKGRSAKTNFNVFFYQTEMMEYEKMISGLDPEQQDRARLTTTLPLDAVPPCQRKFTLLYAEHLKRALEFGQ
ncbi:AP2-like ethylene-responsive transcription factor [Chloropicon primus]|uniref:AP2-like ethylene-responsive transcription factor n=1 Tax=Chloropicon primus TaxID=1764295 RepID=A0A5B8N1U3_9CHLO|nr:AP2-like ethylene-responsive transcription factor [Chloropicon primus]UPR04870.1 AP2-like ethylene-responsive transcription factor [Chloropicon primus]|eukprot:QDZ25674.1 AP2-like ethylene-responsive transcription factor [Chloropicon primus]